MLVLSRKKNESIVINDLITLTVIEIRGDKVRLGIEAPKDVPVHRREVYDAIMAQTRSAGRPQDGITSDLPRPATSETGLAPPPENEVKGTPVV